ncbi:hypothetical protein AZE42_09651 [Rhizopogon vesiculosus]|uniref:Uncharacterized protein n=1 Tax=Rhizopogon vesiculosus TaxID=180088 RepID=A0A1J8QVH2_9AGAM|nr:hypothetical protein AZE42_09651 [Rhizopogon vesiculosus]
MILFSTFTGPNLNTAAVQILQDIDEALDATLSSNQNLLTNAEQTTFLNNHTRLSNVRVQLTESTKCSKLSKIFEEVPEASRERNKDNPSKVSSLRRVYTVDIRRGANHSRIVAYDKTAADICPTQETPEVTRLLLYTPGGSPRASGLGDTLSALSPVQDECHD